MQLTDEQVAKFKEAHEPWGGLNFSDEEVSRVAVGVANYYRALFKIWLRLERDKKLDAPDVS